MNSRLVSVSGDRSQSPYQVDRRKICRRQQSLEVIEIDEADAAAADDRLAGVGKPIVCGKVHDAGVRLGLRVEELLDLAVVYRGGAPSLVRRPGLPRLSRRIAGLEGEQAIVGQVVAGRPQDRDGVLVGQQGLEGVAGHVDEIEALRQSHGLAHALDPGDPLGARPRPRHAQHALRRIDAGHGKTFLGNPARQQSRAAAKVEDSAPLFSVRARPR